MEHKFKPFEPVLVRDFDDADWYPASYRCYDSSSAYPHICDNFRWKQCIPYNEETAHLINTSMSPEQKTISMETKKPTIPPYCDNERKSCGDELKQEPLSLFHVKFTKVIHCDEMLNERQIQVLLKDNQVKSINIEK